jgi:hypothetical protein
MKRPDERIDAQYPTIYTACEIVRGVLRIANGVGPAATGSTLTDSGDLANRSATCINLARLDS